MLTYYVNDYMYDNSYEVSLWEEERIYDYIKLTYNFINRFVSDNYKISR